MAKKKNTRVRFLGGYAARKNLLGIYFAILEFANVLEDCHSLLYSSGQDDNRWLDEYKIENRKLSFNRNICDDHIRTGRLDFYIATAIKNPDDYNFVRTIDMVRKRDIPVKQK